MTAINVIDFTQPRERVVRDLPGLQTYLALLIGEPFQLARVSYGDELTLHFGKLRPAKSAKQAGKLYGESILGVRASGWVLKVGSEPLAFTAGLTLPQDPTDFGQDVSAADLEAKPHIRSGSRVLAATPFAVEPSVGIGLELRFADGSNFLIIPNLDDDHDELLTAGPTDHELPELADWELLTPHGLIAAGPGDIWSFEPKRAPHD